MIQMTFLGGGRIVSFSLPMIFEIAAWILGLGLLSWIDSSASEECHLNHCKIQMCAVQRINKSVGSQVARPLRMNTQLQKLGLIDKKAIDARKVSLDEHGKLNYPLNPLVCKPSKDYNILFLFVDTLRYDMLTEELCLIPGNLP